MSVHNGLVLLLPVAETGRVSTRPISSPVASAIRLAVRASEVVSVYIKARQRREGSQYTKYLPKSLFKFQHEALLFYHCCGYYDRPGHCSSRYQRAARAFGVGL